MGSSKKQVSGYKYFMGLHFGLCHGPVDALLEIRAGDRTAWTGSQTANGQISINVPNLFGGDQKEGGLAGQLDVMMGGATQLANDYLTSKQGGLQPAYRGVVSLVYRGGEVGSNNPYPKPWSFRVRRTTSGWDANNPWYSSKAAITLSNGAMGMNPAHIAYECLTNRDWGMGYPTAALDDTVFRAAADQLYSESFGLCLLWSRQDSIENFLQLIMDYIGGVLVTSPTTGLFQLKLIRGGYTVGSLPTFSAANVLELVSKEDSAITGCTNEMVVRYFDPINKVKASVMLQALGAVQAQGVVISATKDYPGIPTADLAARVAQRELSAVAVPLKRIQIKLDRTAYQLTPGDVFVLNLPSASLASIVFRVGQVDYGTLRNGAITVDAVQDTFSLPSDTYIQVQTTGWSPPNPAPAAPTVYKGVEASYRDLYDELGASTLAALPAGAAYAGVLIARPNGLQVNYQIWTRVSPAAFVKYGLGNFCPTATVQANLNPFDTSCTFQNMVDVVLAGALQLTLPCAALIVDGSSFEIIRIDALDPATGIATIARGCVDSVPAAHPAAVRVYFFDGFVGTDGIQYTAGETVDDRPLTVATQGTLDPSLAPLISTALVGRWQFPYPPQSLKVNGIRWDQLTGVQSGLTLAWYERNRVTQADQLIDTTASTVTPEAGQTYRIDLYDAAGTNFATFTGITGTTWTWASRDSTHLTVRATVTAQRGGFSALQAPQTNLISLLPPAPAAPTYRVAGAYAGKFVIYKITPPAAYSYFDSADGFTWSSHADPGVPSSQFPDASAWVGIQARSGKLYANQNGSGYFWTSNDANWYDTPWSSVVVSGIQAGGLSGYRAGVDYQNGQWIAWDAHVLAAPQIATSSDYATWVLKTVGLPYGAGIYSRIVGIWWDPTNSRYSLAVYQEDRSGGYTVPVVQSVRFYTSTNLTTFTELTSFRVANAEAFDAAQNSATIMVVGGVSTGTAGLYTPTVWRSTDYGATWSQSQPSVPYVPSGFAYSSQTSPFNTAVYDGTDFVVGGFGISGYSTTGTGLTFTATGVAAGFFLYTAGSGTLLRWETGPPSNIYASSDHGVTWTFEFGQEFTPTNSSYVEGTGGWDSPMLLVYDGSNFQVMEFGTDASSAAATAVYAGNGASLTYQNKFAGTPLTGETSEYPEGSAYGGGLYLSFRKEWGYLATVPALSSWYFSYGSNFNALATNSPTWIVGNGEYPIALCYDGSKFVCIGASGSGSHHAYTTTDGVTWTTVGAITTSGAAWTDAGGGAIVLAPKTKCRLRKVGSYYYLLIGGNSWNASGHRVLRSTDLLNWSLCPGTNVVAPYNYWRLFDLAVTSDGTIVLLAGDIRSSTDGIHKGAILTSTDGLNFSIVYADANLEGATYLQQVGSGGHEVVAMGQSVQPLYSTGNVASFSYGTFGGSYPYRPIGNGSRVLALRNTGPSSATVQVWYTDNGSSWTQTTGLS